ncbi:unnamed protein product [Caenorhabditis auriculariae]|uniref:Uncharacterized protein n=1 Tax=Caenorhabditis auriculariae TaxID=2777116 RepID=A0A8S1I0F1_9PELO|nr:unnamed protein product [Caenorhabditis auriculariae]
MVCSLLTSQGLVGATYASKKTRHSDRRVMDYKCQINDGFCRSASRLNCPPSRHNRLSSDVTREISDVGSLCAADEGHVRNRPPNLTTWRSLWPVSPLCGDTCQLAQEEDAVVLRVQGFGIFGACVWDLTDRRQFVINKGRSVVVLCCCAERLGVLYVLKSISRRLVAFTVVQPDRQRHARPASTINCRLAASSSLLRNLSTGSSDLWLIPPSDVHVVQNGCLGFYRFRGVWVAISTGSCLNVCLGLSLSRNFG